MKRKTIIIIAVVAVIIVGCIVVYSIQKSKAAEATELQTVELEKGELIAVVGATGRVRANQSALLNWQTTGTIESICYELDDQVEEGDCLATLERSSLSQTIILAEADLVTAERDLEDLTNSSVAKSQVYQEMVLAQSALDDAEEDLDSKNYDRASPETLDEARANLVIAEDYVTQKEHLYDAVDSRSEDDPIRAEVFAQLASAKKERNRQQANLNWLLGLPDQQELDEAEAALELAEARLTDAEREWERLKNGPDPKDIAAAEARVDAIKSTLALAKLEAPFKGTITEVRSKVGDQVTSGTVTFRIDDLTHLLVDLDVPEVDINRVEVGQSATITFDAIQRKEYTGEVTKVARVGADGEGVVNFTVTIELLDADEDVKPGMTAAVNIITSKLEDVLLVPNRAVRLKNDQRVVYKQTENGPEAVDITIGATSDSYSEIIKGDITAGDTIILNPPANIDGSGGSPFMR